MTLSTLISGAGKVEYDAMPYISLTFTGNNTYTGVTLITSGILKIGDSYGGSISGSSSVELASNSAKLDMSFANQTIKGLNSTFSGAEVILGTRTLTIGVAGQGGGTFAGIFTGTGGNVTKTGSATFTMSNTANTATGAFTHNEGIVKLSGNWHSNSQRSTTIVDSRHRQCNSTKPTPLFRIPLV
jgi:subtilase-type serine protease